MSRSLVEIGRDIEALLLENYYREIEEDPNITGGKDQVVTGVDFVINYDVRLLDGESSGCVNLNLTGNQSGTTTIGLAQRLSAWVGHEYIYQDDED